MVLVDILLYSCCVRVSGAYIFFLLMCRRPPISTLTDTLLPYTTLFRSAGTGVRLIMGAAAGFDLAVGFTGDVSLRGRPMNRVLKPLGEMGARWISRRSEEHTSELQSLMRISYAVFCLKKKKTKQHSTLYKYNLTKQHYFGRHKKEQ